MAAKSPWTSALASQPRGREAAVAWARSAIEGNWLILDTETTGLSAQDMVIEVSAIDCRGKIAFNELIRPTRPIGYFASMVHGIQDRDLAAKKRFDHWHPHLDQLLANRDVIAYNAPFDMRMLAQSCELHGKPRIESRWHCAMRVRKEYTGAAKAGKLEAATHRALGDCEAVLELLRGMVASNQL